MRERTGVVVKALAIVVLQYALILVLTLLVSFPVDMDAGANPLGVLAVLAVTSTAGSALGGWLGLRSGWLRGGASLAIRCLAAAAGVIGTLALGSALGQIREASPFLTLAILAGIVGFHAPGWLPRHS